MEILPYVLFVLGFIGLVGGAELLVRGASRLALAMRISPTVVGLTVVSFGTSSPELAVTLGAVWQDPPQPDIAMGNVVGSNVANILLVLGLAAAVASLPVRRELVRGSLGLVVLSAVGLAALLWDGRLGPLEGLGLTAAGLSYLVVSLWRSRRKSRREMPTPTPDLVAIGQPQSPPARPSKPTSGSDADEVSASETLDLPIPSAIDAVPVRVQITILGLLLDGAFVLIGLGMLILGSDWLVSGAVRMATFLGVSELVISLTIVAVGTSLPEIATTLVAAWRGQRELAVGNAVGSNIFNILLVLGPTAILAPGPLLMSETFLRFDLPILVTVSLVCIPLLMLDFHISRLEGVVMVMAYFGYATVLALRDLEPWQPYQTALLATALGSLGLVGAVSLGQGLRLRRVDRRHEAEPTPNSAAVT